ncbi:PIN domain-containing protein [Calidifontibacter terrae]
MTFEVLLDTCVLYPPTLCDTLLRIAENGAFEPRWSADVLVELERNLSPLPSVGVKGAQARIRAMTDAFPNATVTAYEQLLDDMPGHPDDAHVMAAAVVSRSQVIVTANLKDFPAVELARWGLSVSHPDDFLLDQLDLHPHETLLALRNQSRESSRPAQSLPQLLDSLRRTGVPRFAAAVARIRSQGVHND